MLVLTRKRQEKVRIGENITLTILKIKGNTVRVGIEAPRNVRVIRGELPPKEAGNCVEVVNSYDESHSELDKSDLNLDDAGTDSEFLHARICTTSDSCDAIAYAI